MTTPLKIRILIAHDHPVVLRGLRIVLNAQPDLEVVAEATDGERAVERTLADHPDLAILDISMPRMTGLQAAREITRRRPEVRVLILSMHDNEQYLFEAIKAGASGYVLKTAVDRDLVEACRAAMRGEPFLYPGAVRALDARLPRTGPGRRGAARAPDPAKRRWSSSSPKRTPTTRSPICCASARRPSSAIARISSPSSACATASS